MFLIIFNLAMAIIKIALAWYACFKGSQIALFVLFILMILGVGDNWKSV